MEESGRERRRSLARPIARLAISPIFMANISDSAAAAGAAAAAAIEALTSSTCPQ